MSGGLLVAGTTSDAGKSVLTAGICRWLHRRGRAGGAVQGAEHVQQLGRRGRRRRPRRRDRPGAGDAGRGLRARARTCAFNPVLLKPGSDLRQPGRAARRGGRHGRPPATSAQLRPRLAETAYAALAELRADVRRGDLRGRRQPGRDQPAGRRLRQHGPGPARRPARPSSSATSTGAACSPRCSAPSPCSTPSRPGAGRRLRHQQVPRRPRAARSPGWTCCTALTGRPDARRAAVAPRPLARRRGLARLRPGARPARRRRAAREWLRVAVVRLPRISNATDVEALAAEPGVRVRLTVEPAELADADLVVLPGTKATVDDLPGCARPGWPTRSRAHAAAGRPVLGICGGFQMLAARIHDEVESRRGHACPGSGCCRSRSPSTARKTARPGRRARPSGRRRCAATRSTTGTCHRPTRAWPRCSTYADGTGEGAVGSATCSAPTGTARSSPTSSAAGSSPRRPALAGRAGFAVAPDTGFAAAPGALAGSARRPGRGAPRHRRAVAADRERRARRPALHPARRPARRADPIPAGARRGRQGGAGRAEVRQGGSGADVGRVVGER